MLGEGDAACACTSSSTRRTGCRRSRTPSSSARSSSSPARGTTRSRDALTERFGAARGRLLRSIWAAHLPEHYKGYTSPHGRRAGHRAARAAVREGAVPRLAAAARAAHADRALQARPEGRAGRGAADARGPRAARDRGDLDAADGRRRDVGAGVPRARPGRRSRWTSTRVGDRVAELLAAVHRGDAETDNLNRLVITAGLDRRQVAILRAYRKYRQRVGSRFTESYQNDVLVANSEITAKLVRYFELRFDPELETDEAAEAALRDEILADLDEVASLDHDRILRNQLTVIDATLRTNAYNADREALAFKLRSADVPAMPQPAPYREIYVYSPDVEGIHLRGGPIARGGLRWSDRQDYRTEVFGLMRAQLTKNAVIVPAGAKGGFYIKRGDDVERHYVTFIRSLLSRHRQPRRRQGRAAARGARARRRGHVPRGRGRQGHGDVLRHRQPRLARVRLLARRRVRVRRLGGLRPQGARHHRQGRVGVGQAPLQGARGRHAGRRVHRRRHRRHERRRVRQRDAAERADPARRGLRPPARLHRPDAGRGGRLRGAQAAVRARRARPGTTTTASMLSEGGGVYPRTAKSIRLVAAGARGARRRGRVARRPPTSSARSCARRSTCCGTAASARS